MIVTVEISHYPLTEEYENDIISFISSLKKNDAILVISNAMSTQVKGDYDDVVAQVFTGLKDIFRNGNMSSTVMKLIPRDLPIEDGTLDL